MRRIVPFSGATWVEGRRGVEGCISSLLRLSLSWAGLWGEILSLIRLRQNSVRYAEVRMLCAPIQYAVRKVFLLGFLFAFLSECLVTILSWVVSVLSLNKKGKIRRKTCHRPEASDKLLYRAFCIVL